jgi:isopentenyl-diphosphate delta-isomerase
MKRKGEHLRICLEEGVEVGSNGLEDVILIHNALPEVDLDDVNLSTRLLGKNLDYPIIIEAMTGGTDEGRKVNASLARVAEEMNIGMHVGSQRTAIEDPNLESTFSVVKDKAPSALRIANLGAIQLNNGFGVKECQRAVDMIGADALALHLNPLQEAIQPEGETNFGDLLSKIEEICSKIKKPVIVKEVGCGLSKKTGERLVTAGVACLDVAGFGGTSWNKVEGMRGSGMKKALSKTFEDWGLPTAISLLEVGELDVPKIASGGIRNGIEAAKALVLGADAVGLALPVLRELDKNGEKGVKDYLNSFISELRITMFLVGAKDIKCLKRKDYKVLGKAAQWNS